MKIHIREKAYSCNECPYAASEKGNLETHTGEKPLMRFCLPPHKCIEGTLGSTHCTEKVKQLRVLSYKLPEVA